MKKPFSYTDSACGFVYFNLIPENFGDRKDEIRAALLMRDKDRENFITRLSSILLEILLTEFHDIFFHEWHHSLQNIVYPYRYLQSWRELSIGLRVLSTLRRSTDLFRIDSIDIPPAWIDTINYSSMVHGIIIRDEMLEMVNRDPQDLRPTDMTLTTLIEEATSIFQFKLEKGEEGSGISYRRWIRSTPTYSNMFKLLSKLMGTDDAYVALQPLIQTSFSTTWPITTFVSLVNFTLRETIHPKDFGCDDYYTILRSRLDKLPSGPSPDPNGPMEGDQFSFISHKVYNQIVGSTPKHVIYPLAIQYIGLMARFPILENFLFHPYSKDIMSLFSEEFLPPLTVIRLLGDESNARDMTVIIINPRLKDMQVKIIQELTYSEYLPEIMKRKDIAYSLFTDLNNYLAHNCHHTKCPYYTTNICRRWSAIPKEWSKCPFPQWFNTVSGRSIDFQSGELKKTSQDEGG